MIENENSRIVIGDGWRGRLDTTLTPSSRYVVVHPEDRTPALILPTDLFEQHTNGTLHLTLTRPAAIAHSESISNGSNSNLPDSGTGAGSDEARIVVPVLEETLEIQKRTVETGGVRIVKSVHEHEEIVDEPLSRETVEVTRVRLDRAVDSAVPPREEGNLLIIPIYEERLVVQKQLFLKEEIHVTRQHTVDYHEKQTVTLRREEVAVERQNGERP